MLWHYYAKLRLPDDDAKKRGAGDKDDGFPEVHNAFMIFSGPSACLTAQQRINLPVCFGTPSNYRKEVLTFKVVGFKGTYHAILGWPSYAKVMVVPNYTYLKLKMSGPNSIITIESTYKHAYDCDVECIKYAEAIIEAETLIVNLDQLSSEVPDSKRHARTFEPTKTIKLVSVNPSCPDDRALRISATLDIK
ncbi:uncharacterized protein [Miscanthus floridulus]|uniref:uncharacterized protein n=1 Tax=Miscanthus floridulus TaxID=154761 RepID=UPI0034577FE4